MIKQQPKATYAEPSSRSATPVSSGLKIILAGFVTGLLAVINVTSFAVLVFSGPLAGDRGVGIGIALLSGVIIMLVIGLFSSRPGIIAFPQSAVAPVLALLAAGVSEAYLGGGPGLLPTVIAALMLGALLTGSVFLLLGRFRQGKLIRYVPYPVFGGFMAGGGWLIVGGALKIMTGGRLSLESFQPDLLLHWVPGIGFGLLLLWATIRPNRPGRLANLNFLRLPALLVLGVAAFYAVAWFTSPGAGLVARLGQDGWLVGGMNAGGSFTANLRFFGQAFNPGSLVQIDWGSIFAQSGTLFTLVFIALLGALFNYSSIELSTQQDFDLDHDLMAAGMANLLSGLLAGFTGYPSTGLTLLPRQMGISDGHLGARLASRGVVIVAALTFGLALVFGLAPLALLPQMVVAGLLAYLGMMLMKQWFFDNRKLLPRQDYVVVWVIFGVIVFFNIPAGIVSGILITMALFAVNYGRIGAVRNVLTAQTFSSNVDRPEPDREALQTYGDHIQILQLQGYLFFGSRLDAQMSSGNLASSDDRLGLPRFLILDMHLVSGMDSSAIRALENLKPFGAAATGQVTLVFTRMAKPIEHQLNAAQLAQQASLPVRFFPDLDHGLEWCESRLLDALENKVEETNFPEKTKFPLLRRSDEEHEVSSGPEEVRASTTPRVAGDLPFPLTRREVVYGEILIEQGLPPEKQRFSGITFVDTAELTVQIVEPGGKIRRLRTLRQDSLVGELGLYLGTPASAQVVVSAPGRVYFISKAEIEALEADFPDQAAALHAYIAAKLSKRVALMNAAVQALAD